MTQVALGDCQHIQFSPLFFSHDFKIIPNDYEYLLIELLYRLCWLMFSSSHFLLYVPYPGLFPQSPFSLSVQGRQGHKQIITKSLWGFWCFAQAFFSSPFTFVSESTFSLLHHYEIILLFCSSPGLCSLLCFFWLTFLPCDLCFSNSHCQLQKCSCCLHFHSCLWEPSVTLTCLWTRWGGWEEDLRDQQTPLWWVLGQQWQLLSLCRVTGCWQLSFPPFSHHDQAALLLAHTWLFVLDTFLFWAAASSVAWPPLCPCICQLSTSSSSPEGCRKSGLMAENNTG